MTKVRTPLTREHATKTYIFRAQLQPDEDGRFSAWIEALPGCTAWGHTKAEALVALKDAAEAYLQDMQDAGQELPKEGVEIVEEPVVTVAI